MGLEENAGRLTLIKGREQKLASGGGEEPEDSYNFSPSIPREAFDTSSDYHVAGLFGCC